MAVLQSEFKKWLDIMWGLSAFTYTVGREGRYTTIQAAIDAAAADPAPGAPGGAAESGRRSAGPAATARRLAARAPPPAFAGPANAPSAAMD